MIDYDQLLINTGEEMYNLPAFIRNFHVWKLSHLASRIIPITEKFQLPWNSVLHILDNIQYPPDEIQDVPRIETNPFIVHEQYKKWIYHSTDFIFSTDKVHMPVDIDYNSGMLSNNPTERKYIFKTARLNQNLLSFKTKYRSEYRYIHDLKILPTMKESLVLINHNPLFRVQVFGKLKTFRRLQLILASILNTVCLLPTQREQYIHIPLSTHVFTKDVFRRTTDTLSISTLKYPNNYHYLVMMHFLNYVSPIATTSLLDKLPEEIQKKVVLLFTVGDHALFYPLYDLKVLNDKNIAYIRIVNQLNMLAMSHTEAIQTLVDRVPDEDADTGTSTPQGDTSTQSTIVKDILYSLKKKNSKISGITNTSTDTDIDSEETVDESTEEKDTVDTILDDIENDTDPLSLDVSKEYAQNESDTDVDTTEDDSGAVFDTNDELADDTKELIDIIVAHDKEYSRDKRKRQVSVGVIQAKQMTDKYQLGPTTIIDTVDISTAVREDINHTVLNSPCVRIINESVEDSKKRSLAYIKELDESASILIDNIDDLTPKQKERCKKLAVAYKSILIGKKTIEEWLETPPNVSLKDVELDYLKDQIPDQSMLKSSVLSLDDTYMENTFGRDLLSVITAFTKNGVFLVDIKVEPITTELNKLVKYTFKYEDINGKSSSVHVTLPQVNKHGHMFINGVKKVMKKQMVNLPIIKVSNTRVSLSSAMNKTIVERNLAKAYSYSAHVSTILNKLKDQGLSVKYIATSIKLTIPLAYEYTTLAKQYREIMIANKTKRLIFYFDYHNRLDFFSNGNATLSKRIEDTEKRYKATVFAKDGSDLCYIDINNVVYVINSLAVDHKTTIVSMLHDISNNRLSIRPLAEWTTLKIRDKNLPIIFVLSYQYGLINSLNYIKCHWLRIGKTDKRVVQDNHPSTITPVLPGIKHAHEAYTPIAPGSKYMVKHDDILIPFKNEYIVINRYPLIQSLIATGLLAFDTSIFSIEDMENVSTYFTLLENKGYSTNYLKAITGFFGYFIDPMTRDKLEMMHEPTNVRDLLIRSTQLLATEDYRQASSMANHCIRGYERFNVILFNEMARALETYQIAGGAGSKFTLNPQAVFQRIISDQAIASVEELGVVHDIKEGSTIVYTGVGGRTAQSFVIEDRQFPKDGTGIMSEATVDSSKVAIVAQTSVDPAIVNSRGLFEHKDPNKLEPTEVLSAPSLLMPAVTNDDSKRISFTAIQLSHHLPTISGEVCRVRTGFERVIGHYTTDIFASYAKHDGTVVEVNDKIKMIKIQYDNGDIDTFSYADQHTGSSGLVIEQSLQLAVVQGQKVKRGDVLIYNKHFFKKDPYTTQIDWKHGVTANVMIAERNTTLEDANGISERLGKKFSISPIEVVRVVLHNDSIVHDILPVSKEVLKGDVLITYEDGSLGETLTINSEDSDTLAMIQQMNRSRSKAPISGTIVKIDAFYGCPISDMHPSLGKVVRAIANYKNARAIYAANTDAAYDNPISGPLPKGEKYKGVDIEPNIVVLQFYIRHHVHAGVGDKLVYDSSLKSVISSTFKDPIVTQSGVEVDAVFSGTGILHRVITSPLVVGSLQRVLEKTEKNMIEWWNKKKVV